LEQRLVKTGGRLVKHARYYWLLLAEGHLTRRLFGTDFAADLSAAFTDGVRAGGLPGRKERRAIPAGIVFGGKNLGSAVSLDSRTCAEVPGKW
jgi:hypothetical protein